MQLSYIIYWHEAERHKVSLFPTKLKTPFTNNDNVLSKCQLKGNRKAFQNLLVAKSK